MKNLKILINGAGIAGPTLAWWLTHFGFEPTLIERAPTFRTGGYIVDFWGAGYDVAEQMGLLPALHEDAARVDEIRFVDSKGRAAGGFMADDFRRSLGDRILSIRRGDLARHVFDALECRVRTIFDDCIVNVYQHPGSVQVEFLHSPPERFDLVIGAGGLHSQVRRLVFGSESHFSKYLGYYSAAFTADDYPHNDERAFVSYAVPGRQVSRYSLPDGRTAFFMVFSRDRPTPHVHCSIDSQKDVLRREFHDAGWECNAILKALDDCVDLYFDAVSQIRMGAWSFWRVALVGDACYSPSLLAGQGAALAMAGAYVLAGELRRCDGDFASAFTSYETLLRPMIEKKQASALKFAASFVPRTKAGVFLRNKASRLMRVPYISDVLIGDAMRDSFVLPQYASA